MNVYKVELYVVDFDGLGEDEVVSVLQNTKYPNRCIDPYVKHIDSRKVEWSDEHPLNNIHRRDSELEDLFEDE